jgi:hypothetical protein
MSQSIRRAGIVQQVRNLGRNRMWQLLDDNGQTPTTEQYFHDDEHGAPAAGGGARAGPAAAGGARASASKKDSKGKQAAVPKMINPCNEEEYAQDPDDIYILDRAVIDDLLTRLQQDGTRTVVRVPVVHHGVGSRLMDVRGSAVGTSSELMTRVWNTDANGGLP